jgi:FAD/FMN-containing dehydrogenase/Fe-S oxidoreductase
MSSSVSPRRLEQELRRRLEGEVRFDAGSLALYSTDASNYRQVPVGVVLPRHEGDIRHAVALARENQVPVLMRGGGTSLGGQSCNAALVLDCSKYMTAIRRIDYAAGVAVVEPGLIPAQLNAELAPHGVFFPPDPATKDRCTIGGMIGNNSCGAHSAAYGKTVDHLLGLEVLLYDGTRLVLGSLGAGAAAGAAARTAREEEIFAGLKRISEHYGDLVREHYPRIPRRISGYNLDELLPERGGHVARALVGSEGTLAITLAAAVGIVPRPRELVLVALGLADIFVAADQVPWVLEHHPEALEAFGREMVDFGSAKGLAGARLLPSGAAYLVVELGGATLDEARARGEALIASARHAAECRGAVLLAGQRERDAVWGLRESGLGAGAPRPGFPPVFPGLEDVAVPPARLGAYLRAFDRLLQRRGLVASMYYGHFGEGCVHCRISFDLRSPAGIAQFRATVEEASSLLHDFGGAPSGEHGDGLARSELLPRIFGSELIAAFGEFKRLFDPEGRMNPGNIVAPYPLDSHLRLGPGFRPRAPETVFDFSGDGGLAGHTLRCVGLGKCRKLEGGTMCPSFMVSHEEALSPRGRAHLLFEALSGDLLPGGLADESLRETFAQCLGCKSCKTECNAAVDVAALKAEFLDHYYRRHARPLSARVFGRFPQWARLAALAPRAVNAGNALLSGPLKALLGVHPQRRLPRFAPRTFRAQMARRPARFAAGRRVVLFPDCFNNHCEPPVLLAGVAVLECAGFEAVVPREATCCGRTLISAGMLEAAREQLGHAVRTLKPYLADGLIVVGLEPGCILTFRDELPRLLPHDPDALALSRSALLLDEFLAQHAPEFAPAPLAAHALVHGHCHHRAITGMESEIGLLEKVPGLDLEVLDSGCCGMAGAFGYEKENYEMSRALAERVLRPAIRRAPAGSVVIADGFSCRTQVRHFCPEAKVLHLAQVLSRQLPS